MFFNFLFNMLVIKWHALRVIIYVPIVTAFHVLISFSPLFSRGCIGSVSFFFLSLLSCGFVKSCLWQKAGQCLISLSSFFSPLFSFIGICQWPKVWQCLISFSPSFCPCFSNSCLHWKTWQSVAFLSLLFFFFFFLQQVLFRQMAFTSEKAQHFLLFLK